MVWLENTKADPTQDVMCKQKRGQRVCRVALSHSPADRGQRSECAEVLRRSVSSQSREAGWLLLLSLGKVVGKRGAETEEEGRRGASPPPCPAGEWADQSEAGSWYLWEAGREEAEGLTLIGGQRRSVAIKVSWDAAAGGT